MSISIYDIAFLFSEVFTLYSIKIFYDIFFSFRKDDEYLVIGAYTAYFAGTLVLHFWVTVPFVNLVMNILLLFGITLCYQSTIRKKIVAVSECYLIMFIAEILERVNIKNGIKNHSHSNYSNIDNIKFVITSENFSETFNSEKKSFHFIPAFIQFLIVFPRLFTFFLWRYNRDKPMPHSKGSCFFIFICSVHKKKMSVFRIYSFKKFSSFGCIMSVSCRNMKC